jgi:hypothetical protein
MHDSRYFHGISTARGRHRLHALSMETHRPRTLPRGFFPAVVTLMLLAIPLVAMQYTDEVQWDPPDFLIMGVLLMATGLALEWAIRRKGPLGSRAAWTLALLSTFLMVWTNMATGLLGGEDNPANMLLLTVPLVGAVGATLARLQPRGMAFTLFAMAVLHLSLTAIAASQGWRPLRQGLIDIWAPNGFFILLFLSGAALFLGVAQVNRKLQAAVMILLGITIGACGVTVGAIDDAPGASLMGLVLMLGLLFLGVRLATRKQ